MIREIRKNNECCLKDTLFLITFKDVDTTQTQQFLDTKLIETFDIAFVVARGGVLFY